MEDRLRYNNFALIRLGLSSVVIAIHLAILAGTSGGGQLAVVLTPASAARAFFCMSGFLVLMSYERTVSLRSYARKRLLRVYPGYAAAVLVAALMLSPSYDESWLRYVSANLALINFAAPTLPGVFEHNPLHAINGALWSVKVEIMFYAVVPLIAWCVRRWGPDRPLAAMYIGSVIFEGIAAHYATTSALWSGLRVQLPSQMSCFAAGAWIFYRLDWFGDNFKRLWPLALALFVSGWITDAWFLIPASLAFLVMSAGLSGCIIDAAKHGDYSYGLYLVHFPIIQAVLASGIKPSPLYVLLSLASICLAAFMMFRLVEQPMMRLRLPRLRWPSTAVN